MLNRKNKKAQLGHGVTWLYKFFILILIIGGVVAVVSAHYSKQYDIRDIESSIIARKIVECIAPNGVIKEFSREVIRNCISFNEREIYINITLENNNKNAIDNMVFGDDFLATLCQAKEKDIKVKYYPSCLKEKYYVLDEVDNKQTISMFLAIKKIEKNL